MFCKNCGNEIAKEAVICVSCGVPTTKGNQFCWNCGEATNPEADVCLKCGVNLKKGQKHFETTIILCLLLLVGFGGIHRLYTGHIGIGIVQLVTWGGCGIWQLIDFIAIVQGKFKDADGNIIQKQRLGL
jgi:TM2 domain-containing membrane protein YozV